MKTKLQAIAAVFCGFLFAQATYAADKGAYWTNPDGDVYKNGEGECWKKPTWTEADAIMECDPDLVPKPKPKRAAAPEPIAPPPAPPEPRIEKINLGGDTHFEFDSAKLKPEGDRLVRELAGRLKGVDDIEAIYVGGHTDSVGTEEYNLGLSQERAATVKKAFVEEGINPDVIVTQGYGESVPIASNDSPEGRAQNRRVEVEVRALNTVTPSE
jgi:OOP family OmpA-OmpF porin